jgi:hypothetical protein
MAAAVGQVEGLQFEREITDLGMPQLPRAERVAPHPVLHPQRRELLAAHREFADQCGQLAVVGVAARGDPQ